MIKLKIVGPGAIYQDPGFNGIGQEELYGGQRCFKVHFDTEQVRDNFWTSLLTAHVCGFTKYGKLDVIFTCGVDATMIQTFRIAGIEVQDARQLEFA